MTIAHGIKKHLLVLSTGQHVGKTTTSLGLVAHLQERFSLEVHGTTTPKKEVAYCKPVGQQHVPVGGGLRVDKDSFLFKEHFGLVHDYKDMSPVIFPDGFTRDYIDGKVTAAELTESVRVAHRHLMDTSEFVVVEGTGHTGVGSICDINNAQVAAELGMDAICIALGGLGSSFDQLALNREMLLKHGVQLKHSGRGDVIDAILANQAEYRRRGDNLHPGLIMTGWDHPSPSLIARLNEGNIPCIYVPPTTCDSFQLTAKIAGFTAKLNRYDTKRLHLATQHVRDHVNFDLLGI
ncbi:hypothetical protein DYB37_003459 [Aphanomyces astaci]|uniref:DRTGG domain-containing protein n=1 Tax=Aphanomyces astaci TaxID=112090 RepID=A0A418DJG5_APHAT|nr:hypothetical protein DYB35_003460 [Aphanomyces astaci]RHZ34287.1 hypothetical protein DYB37_003459 [Aphanomyces astaci]